MSDFSDYNISIPPGRTTGQVYTLCPECSSERKAHNKKGKCLSVNIDKGVWLCNNCGWKGHLNGAAMNGTHQIKAIEPPPRVKQKFLEEPNWNWIFQDTTIDPVPADPKKITGQHTVTFYFRDHDGRLTGAKKMLYNFADGAMKRDHQNPPMHLFQRDSGYYPSMFYEYHLTKYPKATVILVESEKTAAMLTRKFSDYLQEFIYVATGGSKGLTDEKLPVLKNRTIWVCYDCDNGDLMPDGSVRNPKGREGAASANEKLQTIADSRVIDLDPSRNDGLDLADIIKEVTIQYIRELPTRLPLAIKEMWDDVMIDQEPPAEIPLLYIQGVPIATHGNHSLIIGKKKSRKSLFISWLIAEYLKRPNTNPKEILLFDTEQGKRRAYLMRERIRTLTGHHIPVFDLRGKSYSERQQIIADTLRYWSITPKLVIIDGIRDLMSNINDPDQSTELIVWLERQILKYNCHVINILHMNKTDSNARGHIGSELLNKAEMTIELELDTQENVTKVKCESSRDKPFETFSFWHDKDGLPEVVGTVTERKQDNENNTRQLLVAAFADGPMVYRDLVEELRAQFGIGKTKAETFIRKFRRDGWIIKSGSDKDPKALWKLVITADGFTEPQQYSEYPEPSPQLSFDLPAPVEADEPPDGLPF